MEQNTIDPFEYYYVDACKKPSDINEHLPVLYALAMNCHTITEFGVRTGNSTKAFLYAATRVIGPSLDSYNLRIEPSIKKLFDKARSEGAWAFEHVGNSLEIDIAPTDMLLIDSWHEYDHLTKELERHHHKVGKYLVFHDTITYPNILSAIIHFMILHPEWEFHNHYTHNNGLTILRRKSIV
jgi:hypothetical protein